MRYYLITGETSGDLHGSNLIREIIKLDPNAEIRCWGGDQIQKAGGKIVRHIRNLAFMGFWEVITNLKTILSNLKFCKEDIISFNPDVLILIDYPGFNLRIAEFAKKRGFRVVYYISPQVWAWKEGRVKKIKRVVDQMLVILPFEKDFYRKWNYEVEYVGHPLLDVIPKESVKDNFKEKHSLENSFIVALLPGSRKQEIRKILKEQLTLVKHFPEKNFVIAGLNDIGREFYQSICDQCGVNPKIIIDETGALLNNAQLALVTSGTATLETSLYKVPQIVCYKGSRFSYIIGRYLVNVKYISLVNLILDKPLLTELIQNDLNEKMLLSSFKLLLKDEPQERIFLNYAKLRKKLGGSGASARAAKSICKKLKVELGGVEPPTS